MSQPQPPAYPPAPGPQGWGAPPAFPPPVPGQLPAIQTQAPAYAAPGQAPAGAPAYPAAPVGLPTYPAAPVGLPAYPAAAQPQINACRMCGSVPAVDTKFRGHQGMLVVMRFLSHEGPFCRDCGLGVFRYMTSRTLVQGWYGYASFVITPITVLMNVARRAKVAALPAPQSNPHGPSRPPMDPGPTLMSRPMTWAGLAIPLVLIALLVVAATSR